MITLSELAMTPPIDSALLAKTLLDTVPGIELAFVFGSIARGVQRPDSDIDVAVQICGRLDAAQKIALIEAVALLSDRPVDLIDLHEAGQPLLDQIVSSGVQIIGNDTDRARLVFRNIMENEDFVPYQRRILEERQRLWTGS